MPCGCQGANAHRHSFRAPATPKQAPSQRAAQAATTSMYEVLDGQGRSTGRRFSSLVAASNYARTRGGTTRPV